MLARLPPHATRAPERNRGNSTEHDADDKPRVVFLLTWGFGHLSQPPSATTTTKASASKLSVPTSVWIWINVPFGRISKAVNVSAVGTSSSVPSTRQSASKRKLVPG